MGEPMPVLWLLLSMSLSQLSLPAAAVSARTTPNKDKLPAIIEFGPLKGMLGQPSLRVEIPLPWSGLGLALNYDQEQGLGERTGFIDTDRYFASEAVYYPMRAQHLPWFFAGGVLLHQREQGRQQERDYQTWNGVRGDQMFDQWVSHEQYLAASQSIGYRWSMLDLFTASLRAVRDQKLLRLSSTVDRDGIYSEDIDVTARERPPVHLRLMLHAGVKFHGR